MTRSSDEQPARDDESSQPVTTAPLPDATSTTDGTGAPEETSTSETPGTPEDTIAAEGPGTSEDPSSTDDPGSTEAVTAAEGTGDDAHEQTPPADTVEPVQAPAPAPGGTQEADPAPATPAPKPSPAMMAQRGAPRPTPPKPGSPRPAARQRATGSTTASPPSPSVPVRPASDPAPFGRVGDDGTVFVVTADGEREVGSAAGTAAEEALAPFGRAFDDLVAQVDLVEARLDAGEGAPAEAVGTLRALRGSLSGAPVVGDLDALAQRTRDLETRAAAARAEADERRAASRAAALAAREEVVSAAEAVAATDPAKMQWRPAGERLKTLLDEWKEAQRTSGKLDKRSEDELWKRFSAARTAFDRARRSHFAAMESSNAEAKAAKSALVVEAESMVGSTDWGATASAYKRLMDRWRTAGHAGRRDDDALWARFRAAQDAFFSARHAAAEVEDAAFSENLVVKEALLVEAEKLLPVRDHRAARRALRDLGERWEEAGKVPRGDLARVEKRLRAVENAVADAERETWRRSDPEKSSRASGAVAQLEKAVGDLRAQQEAAQASGDEKAAEAARAALEARQMWLDAARATAQEFSG